MEDLSYIIGLGFSGTDVWRAVIISFFAAMLVRKRKDMVRMTLLALVFDRIIWPLTDMAFSGASQTSIMGALSAIIETFPTELGLYVVRYAGLYVLITMFMLLRRRIHTPALEKKKAKAPRPAYS